LLRRELKLSDSVPSDITLYRSIVSKVRISK
jgi:hypothetical protein